MDMSVNVILLTTLAFSGISLPIVRHVEVFFPDPYLAFLFFLALIGASASLIGFPLAFYGSYLLEHRFGLSNQSVFAWLIERVKSLVVSLSLGIPVALVFYYLLRTTGAWWWLFFSLFTFLFAVLLARLSPVLIYPLFYKFRPLGNEEIIQRINALLSDQHVSVRGIYTFNMSRDTKKANAGFTGIGKSRRIILSDTLIDHFTPDEIRVVFAHELGHYMRRHIVKGILISGILMFTSFYLCGLVYDGTLSRFGFIHVYDIAATPLLFFYLGVLSLLLMPATNALSRRFEREADRCALEFTGDRDSFISSMEKLAETNLADMNPPRLVEFLFYSHPSLDKRIAAADLRSYARKSRGGE